MSSLEQWKIAKAAFEATEREYNLAHQAVTDAGAKRSRTCDALVVAAAKLSPDEKIQAAEYQFGSAVPPAHRNSAAE